MEKWQEACNKVFQNSQFNIESLNRPSDVAQVDQQARVYRRASIDNYPLKAKDISKLKLFSLGEVKKVRTVDPDTQIEAKSKAESDKGEQNWIHLVLYASYSGFQNTRLVMHRWFLCLLSYRPQL